MHAHAFKKQSLRNKLSYLYIFNLLRRRSQIPKIHISTQVDFTRKLQNLIIFHEFVLSDPTNAVRKKGILPIINKQASSVVFCDQRG